MRLRNRRLAAALAVLAAALFGSFPSRTHEAQIVIGGTTLAGATTVGLLPALLSRASLLITNDSGPMHVAAAVGTPIVALFGPTSADRTGPYGVGHAVLKGKVPCSPCFSRTCHNTLPLECLRMVSPEQVLAAARERRRLRMVPQ